MKTKWIFLALLLSCLAWGRVARAEDDDADPAAQAEKLEQALGQLDSLDDEGLRSLALDLAAEPEGQRDPLQSPDLYYLPETSKASRLKLLRLAELLGSTALRCRLRSDLRLALADTDPDIAAAAAKAAEAVDPGIVRAFRRAKAAPAAVSPSAVAWASGPLLGVGQEPEAWMEFRLQALSLPAEATRAELTVQAADGKALKLYPVMLRYPSSVSGTSGELLRSWSRDYAADEAPSSQDGGKLRVKIEGAAFSALTDSVTVMLDLSASSAALGEQRLSLAFFDAKGSSLPAALPPLTLGTSADAADAPALKAMAVLLAPELGKFETNDFESFELHQEDLDGDAVPELWESWTWRKGRGEQKKTLAFKKTKGAWEPLLQLDSEARPCYFKLSETAGILAFAEPGSQNEILVFAVEGAEARETFSAPTGGSDGRQNAGFSQLLISRGGRLELYRRLDYAGAERLDWGAPRFRRALLSWDRGSRSFNAGEFQAVPEAERAAFEEDSSPDWQLQALRQFMLQPYQP